jgi:hypothetical protein
MREYNLPAPGIVAAERACGDPTGKTPPTLHSKDWKTHNLFEREHQCCLGRALASRHRLFTAFSQNVSCDNDGFVPDGIPVYKRERGRDQLYFESRRSTDVKQVLDLDATQRKEEARNRYLDTYYIYTYIRAKRGFGRARSRSFLVGQILGA